MHENAFNLGPLEIKWYGVLVALGLLAGLWTATRRGARAGLPPEAVADTVFWLIVGGIVGARLFYVVTYWREEFAGKPLWNIFAFRSGVVFYGGLIVATLAGIVHLRLKKLPVWKFADVLAPSVALGHAFGRVGCLMTGCCFGRVAEGFACAVRFPPGAPAAALHEQLGRIPPNSPSLPVHPVQLYESVLDLALYAALAWAFRRRRFDGQIFALYLLAYAPLRAFVEFFRGDYGTKHFLGLTPGQFVSGGIFSAGVLLYLWRRSPPSSAETKS